MARRGPVLALALTLGACDGGEAPAVDNVQPAAPSRNVAAPPVAVQRPLSAMNSAEEASDTDSAMTLDPQGLRASETELGTGGLLAFGASADLAVEALNHVIGSGPADDMIVSTCGPAPTRVVRWAAGFTLIARDGRFAGWDLERPGFAFANGVQVGSTLRELGAAFPVSVSRRAADVGFTVTNRDGAIGGTLAGVRGDARVLSIHAGSTCVPQAPSPSPAASGNAAAARRR